MDAQIIAELGTAGGTLILAVATFASVRSAKRSAQAAERSLLAGLRPLLVASRLQDVEQKVGFIDEHYVHLKGGMGSAELGDDVVWMTMSLRNVGMGVGVLDGWMVHAERLAGADEGPRDIKDFHKLTRDIYIAASDVGFWQGALRDTDTEEFRAVSKAVADRQPLTIDLLYGDFEGGQRVVSRFSLVPRGEDGWLCSNARHWNLDRPDPR